MKNFEKLVLTVAIAMTFGAENAAANSLPPTPENTLPPTDGWIVAQQPKTNPLLRVYTNERQ